MAHVFKSEPQEEYSKYEDKYGNAVFQNDIVEKKPADKVEPKLTDGFGLSNLRLSVTQIQAIENYVKKYVEFINS